MPAEPLPELVVFYDGKCPVCSREIAWYRARESSGQVTYVDLSRDATARRLPETLTRDAALRRFHVYCSEQGLVSGIAAFSALWMRYRLTRWLGIATRGRCMQMMLEPVYALFLRVRPTRVGPVAS